MIKYQVDRASDKDRFNRRKNESEWQELDSIGPIVDALYDADVVFVIAKYKNWEFCFDPTWADDETCCASFVYDIKDDFDRGDQDPEEFFFAPSPEDIPDMVREVFNYAIALNHQKIRELQEQNKFMTKFCK